MTSMFTIRVDDKVMTCDDYAVAVMLCADAFARDADSVEVEVDGDSGYRYYELVDDDNPNVGIIANKLASVSSQQHGGESANRWTELRLFRTMEGVYVAQQRGCSRWEGEYERNEVLTADTAEEMTRKLGYGWLAKELYDDAGITYVVPV